MDTLRLMEAGDSCEAKHIKNRKSIAITTSVVRNARRMSARIVSSFADHISIPDTDLRHCQEQYFSNARSPTKNWRTTLQRSATTSAKSPHKEGIFIVHAENIRESKAPRSATVVLHADSVVANVGHPEDSEFAKKLFYNAINHARQSEAVLQVKLDPALSAVVQDYADALQPMQTQRQAFDITRTPASAVVQQRMLPDGRESVRLSSTPGYGVLACCERWYSGKYRRHFPGERHGRRVTHGPAQRSQNAGADQPDLLAALEAMVDPKWTAMGIGMTRDGRWIVDFVGPADHILRKADSIVDMDESSVHELPALDESTRKDYISVVAEERTLRHKQSSVDLAAWYAELGDQLSVLDEQDEPVDDIGDRGWTAHIEKDRMLAMTVPIVESE